MSPAWLTNAKINNIEPTRGTHAIWASMTHATHAFRSAQLEGLLLASPVLVAQASGTSSSIRSLVVVVANGQLLRPDAEKALACKVFPVAPKKYKVWGVALWSTWTLQLDSY